MVFKFIENLSFRQVMWLIAFACVAMLGFGYYLQHVVGLEPCPMCVVQRYAMVIIAVLAIITPAIATKFIFLTGSGLLIVTALTGAFVAARQSWLQWYPPEIASCGRDIYGMIETFPLQKVLPMIFKGSGDCTKIDWMFLGLSIANWSFLCFCGIAIIAIWNLLKNK